MSIRVDMFRYEEFQKSENYVLTTYMPVHVSWYINTGQRVDLAMQAVLATVYFSLKALG